MNSYIPKSQPGLERLKYINALKQHSQKLNAFDLVVLAAVAIAVMLALFMSTAFIASALFAGFGIVVGVAIVIHKFEFIRKFIVKYDKWVDASLLVAGFVLAGSVEGMATAAFASLLVSGYLIFARQIYNDDLTNFGFKALWKRLTKRSKNQQLILATAK